MVAAYYSNSSFNEGEGGQEARIEIVDGITDNAREVVRWLRSGGEPSEEQKLQEDAWENDPLFRNVRRQNRGAIAIPNAGRADEMMEAERHLKVVE